MRSISYGAEEHPATVKRCITVPVALLPLKDKRAIYKARLIAGVRWSPEPPKNSGLKPGECGEHGYIHISCETFPEAAMNLKWASDVLDRLIAEANVLTILLLSVCGTYVNFLHRIPTIALKTYRTIDDTYRPK